MSSIQILSDLHLEAPKSYDVFEITPTAPYLALLGDIGCLKDEDYLLFLEKQLSQFKMVFLLLGNHEPYHSNWATAKQTLHDFSTAINAKSDAGNLGKLVFLDQTRYDLSPTTTILGCTLFSRITPEQNDHVSFGVNDFYHIDDWTVEQHNAAHATDLAWLNAEIKNIAENEPQRKVIVFTHHSPSTAAEATDPAHAKSKISSGFATDLSKEFCWKSGVVKAWCFGHTHFNCDFVDGESGIRVLANQRGYYFRQAVGFEEGKFMEI